MLDITKCISLGHLENDHETYNDWKEAVIFSLPERCYLLQWIWEDTYYKELLIRRLIFSNFSYPQLEVWKLKQPWIGSECSTVISRLNFPYDEGVEQKYCH